MRNLACHMRVNVKFKLSSTVATSMPSLTSQTCSDSLPAVCLAGQVGAIYGTP